MARAATKTKAPTSTPTSAPKGLLTVHVVQIVRGYSMRGGFHKDRLKYASALGDREVILCLNKRQNIARLYDQASAVHNYYAPKGERFDAEALQQMVETIGLWLKIPPRDAK